MKGRDCSRSPGRRRPDIRKMKNLLILGAKGTLGGQLRKLYPQAIAWDREDADVRDFRSLEEKIKALDPPPQAIINCVAFNDVDGRAEAGRLMGSTAERTQGAAHHYQRCQSVRRNFCNMPDTPRQADVRYFSHDLADGRIKLQHLAPLAPVDIQPRSV